MGLFTSPTLQKESDKAAQILKSFITKNKIPPLILARARGLAIFSAIRAGMWLSGSGGSGIIIARLADGSWSPPSAFSVRSAGIGLVGGVDVYECVCVLNTAEAVAAYSSPDLDIGAAAAFAAGPISTTAGGPNSSAGAKDIKPVWTYTRSLGLYGGVTVDGTFIKERKDVNAEAYGVGVGVERILQGDCKGGMIGGGLGEVLSGVEGKTGDKEVSKEGTSGAMMA